MKTFCILIISIFISQIAVAQREIKVENISNHLGDSITFVCRIIEVSKESNANSQSIKLKISPVESKSGVAIVRIINNQNGSDFLSRSKLSNRIIRVTGKVELLDSNYQITAKDERQIALILGE